jgi:NAD(P)-dependent dehydrogenase (short-subunit alcohol dehydrogenase family)
MPSLQGRVALVTGGGSGIGRATAVRLAQAGARVMIADYMPEGVEKVVKAIRDAGGRSELLCGQCLRH